MALTAAERQAARRDRVQQTIDELTGSNAALVAQLKAERDTSASLRSESASLRSELEAIKTRLQAAEMATLKAKVRELQKAAQKPA